MYIKAIHTIQRAPNAKPPVVYPGEVADLDGDELDYVLRPDVRAAVEATDEDLMRAGFKVRRDPDAEAAAEAAEKEAAAKASKKGPKKVDEDEALV